MTKNERIKLASTMALKIYLPAYNRLIGKHPDRNIDLDLLTSLQEDAVLDALAILNQVETCVSDEEVKIQSREVHSEIEKLQTFKKSFEKTFSED